MHQKRGTVRYNTEKRVIPSVMVKEKLAESAFHEFSKRGYFATNPDTITRLMRVNRAIFYLHFKNKNDILMYLVNEMMEDLSGLLQDTRAHKLWLNKNNPKDFEEPFKYITDIFNSHSGLVRAFMQGVVADKDLLNQFNLICENFSVIFKNKINSLQNAGKFRGCDTQVIAHTMAIILISSIFSLSTGIIECSPDQLSKTIAMLFYAVLHFDEKAIKKSNSNIPNSEKSRNTRRLIMRSAKAAFEKHGHSKVSMEKIAKDAGFTRATIYIYYKRKKDLIEALKKESINLRSSPPDICDLDIEVEKKSDKTVKKRSEKVKRPNITRQKILAEAKIVFAEKGYFETTLETISKSTGYSRSTLYIYFKKKDDIIRALLEEMMKEVDPSNIPRIFKDIDTLSIDDLMRANNLIIDIFNNDPMVTWIWLQGVFYSPGLAWNFKALYRQLTVPINKAINSSKKEGKCKNVNTQTASSIILTGLCYSSALYTEGFIKSSKKELSLILAKFICAFFNY